MNHKKVLITGAASGIGRATAIRFANEGYDVCLNDIQSNKLQIVLSELEPGDHLLFPGSFADEKVIAAGEKLISEKWNRLDALINCAGLFNKSDPLTMDLLQWRQVLDIMLNGCFLITKLALQFMNSGARIVHISSIQGERAEKHSSSYGIAKAGINQYCRSMALELADRNILVNAIAPGFINTGMSVIDGENELETKWFKDKYIDSQQLPLRRPGTAEEIAGVAFFLSGKDASYITGQIITVDGGLTITF